MSDAVAPHRTEPYGPRTNSCATELVCRDCGYRTPLLDTAFKCPACGEGLDIDYDYERAKELIAERGPAERPWNVWRFEELLPIVSRRAQQGVPARVEYSLTTRGHTLRPVLGALWRWGVQDENSWASD